MFTKHLIALFIVFCLTTHPSRAQEEVSTSKGLFEKAIPLKNGLILVKKGKLYGCIDATQKIIIPIEYEFIGNFINDLAVVKKNKKLGIISSNNTIVISPIYDEISSFTDQLDYYRVKQKDLFGLIDKTGKFVFPIEYDEIGLFYKDNLLSEGLTTIAKNGKYGYANLEGTIVIPMQFDSADYFSDGLALVKTDNKQHFINEKGATVFVVPNKYHFVDSFSEGRARVSTNDHFGYIDKTGKLIIPMDYQMVWGFENGVSLVKKGNKKESFFGCINKLGNYIISPEEQYKQITVEKNACFMVLKNNKFGLYDQKGKRIFAPIYDDISFLNNGNFIAKTNNQYAFYDAKGVLISKLKYNHVFPFNKGKAVFYDSEKKKYGYLDEEGKELIGAQFEEAWNFNDGLACVKINNKLGFIDVNGTFIIEAIYSNCDTEFHYGYANVLLNEKWYLIDKKGNIFLEIKNGGAD